jgi:hypothetical protein
MHWNDVPNQAHSLDGAERGCLRFGHQWRAASDADRWSRLNMNTLKAALADWQNLMVRKCSWARSHSALLQGSTRLGEHGNI